MYQNYSYFLPDVLKPDPRDEGYGQPVEGSYKQKKKRHASNNFLILSIFFFIPALLLAVWLGINHSKLSHMDSLFKSISLGGSFTQAEAKTIDFATSAIFSQIILEALNQYWFGAARVSAPSAHPNKDQVTSLHSMIAASNTEHGNYDIPKLVALLRSRSGRISTLAWLSITAALTKTAFSNLIAYEANTNAAGSSAELSYRVLADPVVLSSAYASPNNTLLQGSDGTGPYMFDINKTSSFAQSVTSMLTKLALEDQASQHNLLYYLNFNVTSASLNSLMDDQAINLEQVPGYNASITCRSDWQPGHLEISDSTQPKAAFKMRLANDDQASDDDVDTFSSFIPSPLSSIQNGTSLMPFVAFNEEESEVYLGHAYPLDYTKQGFNAVNTIFGEIDAKTFDMSEQGWDGEITKVSIWGMRCQIKRVTGVMTISSPGPGQMFGPDMDDKELESFNGTPKNINRLVLKDVQLFLNYQAPNSFFPGIGGAIGASANPCSVQSYKKDSACGTRPFDSISYEALAANYLFAAMFTEFEAYDIAGDIALEERFPGDPNANATYIRTSKGKQRGSLYSITYVPVLLFFGLFCTTLSSAIVMVLSLQSRNTFASKEFRKVDSLRLLVDSIAGLKDEYPQHEWDIVREYSNDDLEKWAKEFKIAYSHVYRERDAMGAPVGQTTVLIPWHVQQPKVEARKRRIAAKKEKPKEMSEKEMEIDVTERHGWR